MVGMTTAMVSMNALVSHCPSSGGMWSERLSSGMAIAIVVSLRIATNAATRRSQMTRIPAGSVALAAGLSAVYPSDSPGGWQIVGRTDVTLFDPDRDPPSLLQPGTLVRFTDGEAP